MELEEAKKKIIELSERLHHYNYMYYVKSESLVSDYDFDMLLKELEVLEDCFPSLVASNSPSKRVGGVVVKNFETVKHRFPMLSLSNSYSKEEIIEWEERIKKTIEQDIVNYRAGLLHLFEVFKDIETPYYAQPFPLKSPPASRLF